MISSNDLRPGMTIVHRDAVHEVVEYQHIKPGKGHAFVRAKLKNMINGSIFEENFRSKQPLDQAIVEKKELEYLYRDKDMFYFMDPENYEHTPVSQKILEPLLEYLKEGEKVYFTFYQGQVLQVNLPDFMSLKVAFTLPGVKGDTAQGGTKPATLETGKVVQVPLFINEGDKLKIDIRTGRYIERVSQK